MHTRNFIIFWYIVIYWEIKGETNLKIVQKFGRDHFRHFVGIGKKSSRRYTSIFQAEVCAIGRCAEINLQRNYRDKDISILSDSQAALKALSKAKITSKLVNEVRTALDKLGAVNKLTIRLVPGHNNIPGNELADNLARKGAENPLIGPEPFCGVVTTEYGAN